MTTNIGPHHLENSKVTNTESEMAVVLNNYFAPVFTVENPYQIQEITTAQSNLIPSSDCDFTEDNITMALDMIKVNKTSDPDCIA